MKAYGQEVFIIVVFQLSFSWRFHHMFKCM